MSAEAIRFLQEAKKEENFEDIYLDDIEIKKLDAPLLKEFESMTEIICLSMNGCKLGSQDKFPTLPKLVRLELIENEFSGNDLVHLSNLTELQSLSLGCNEITDVKQLEPLTQLDNLIQQDLSDCPIAEKENYRDDVFKKFPNLKIQDNKDAQGNEFEYSESDDCQEVDDEEDIEDVDDESEEDDENGEDDEEDDEEDDDEEEEDADGKPTKKVKE